MLSSRPLQIPLNDDASSTNFAHARTPAKALLKQRTAGLRENAIYNGPMTVKAKGKGVLHTPFNHARKAPQTAIKVKTTATPSIYAPRPLGDKTPFPNRQYQPAQLRTPKPQAAKLLLETQDEDAEMLAQTPECLLLPSATRRRKSLRLPSATSKNLKTPMTKGNHWDVSDGDLELGSDEGDSQGEVDIHGNKVQGVGGDVHGMEEEEDDEIEYMPPKVPEQPWTPPFDMPDYKHLGQALLRVAHGARIDDSADLYYSQDIESLIDVPQLLKDSGTFEPSTLELHDLDDDDPFAVVERELAAPKSFAASTHTRPPSVASTSRPGSRSGTALVRPDSQVSTRSRSALTPTPTLATRSRSATQAASGPVSYGDPGAARSARPVTRAASGSAETSRVVPTTRESSTAASSRPVTRSTSGVITNTQPTRRVQPARTASTRSIPTTEGGAGREIRSTTAKSVTTVKTAASVSRSAVPTIKTASSRPSSRQAKAGLIADTVADLDFGGLGEHDEFTFDI